MFEFTSKAKRFSLILMVIGALSIAYSFLGGGSAAHHDEEHTEAVQTAEAGQDGHAADDHADHHEAAAGEHHGDDAHAEHHAHQMANKPWANLLVNNFFFMAIALAALFFLAVQYAAQVGWSVVILRILEAMASFLWIPVVIMIAIIAVGVTHGHHIWHWMAEGIMDPTSPNYDSIIAGKEGYLNPMFFIVRSVIYLIGWVWAAKTLRKLSIKMEQNSGEITWNLWRKARNVGAGFLVFFAVTSSTMAWDWIMSIDTHWFSTLFGWYVFAGMFVSSLTVITLIAIYLKNKGFLPELRQDHLHDLGKFMFAFSIFWTYLWFSQFMLIWYSNIPEEVTYYMQRFGEFKGPFLTMVVLNFVFPVLVLMSRDTKRNRGFVITAGIIIIIGHWLDTFVMIMPGSVGANWSIGLVNLGTFLGYMGLFIWVVFSSLAKASMVNKNHPMWIESEHHHI